MKRLEFVTHKKRPKVVHFRVLVTRFDPKTKKPQYASFTFRPSPAEAKMSADALAEGIAESLEDENAA